MTKRQPAQRGSKGAVVQNRIGRLVSMLFVVGTIATYSTVTLDPIPSMAYDKVDSILAASSIESVFPLEGSPQLFAFLVISILPAFFALMYFLNIKYSNIFFVATFAVYLASPLIFNFEGAELYSSLDIFSENLLSALGGALCFLIISTNGILTGSTQDISDARG
jgi:hypothetical protein